MSSASMIIIWNFTTVVKRRSRDYCFTVAVGMIITVQGVNYLRGTGGIKDTVSLYDANLIA